METSKHTSSELQSLVGENSCRVTPAGRIVGVCWRQVPVLIQIQIKYNMIKQSMALLPSLTEHRKQKNLQTTRVLRQGFSN